MPTSYFVPRLCSIWQNGDGYTIYALAPHSEMCTRGCLRRQFSQSSYCIHLTTYGCIFVHMYRIVRLKKRVFSHITFPTSVQGHFISRSLYFSTFVFSNAVERDPTHSHIISLSMGTWSHLLTIPVLFSCKAGSFRIAQVCTGHTRGCLAFMGSVSHSLVWHIHTGILLEGIVKGFGSIPPALSYIKAQTTTLSMPFVGPLTFEGVGPLVQSVWENNRCLIVLTRRLSG